MSNEQEQAFEKHGRLRENILFAANNWKVDFRHWNDLLQEINEVCYKLDDALKALAEEKERHEKEEKHIDCPYCDGEGWTAEHSGHPPDEACVECPIQMPCGYCYGEGRITTKLMKEHIESSKKVNSDDLPF